MKKTVFLLLALCALIFKVGAQVLPDVASQYSPSIVIRVHDVVTKVSLTDDKQRELANFFRQTDSMLSSKIISGISTSAVDTLQRNIQAGFQLILGSSKSGEYYSKKLAFQAEQEGSTLAQVAKNKYNCDTAITNKLKKYYTQRRVAFGKVFYSQYNDSSVLTNRLYNAAVFYDTVLEKYTYIASTALFINGKVAVLNGIKPLTAPVEATLRNKFTNLCNTKKENGLVENFTEALHKTTADTAYYSVLFKDQISSKAVASASQSIRKLQQKKKINQAGATGLYPVLLQKEKQIALINIAHTNRAVIDSLVKIVNSNYDSLENAILVQNGVDLPSSQFAVAIKYKAAIGLTDSQVDALVAKSTRLKEMKDSFLMKEPFGKYDSKAFETNGMLGIVTEDQYTRVLKIKNKSQADNEAKADWDELQSRGLTSAINKDTAIRQLTNYYIAKWTAYYRYGNDKLLQASNVKAIENAMPAPLRALRNARKQNNASTNGSQYQW